MFSSLLFHKWLIDIVSIAHLPKKSDIFCESFPRNPQFRSRHPLLGRLRVHHAVYGTVCTNAAFLGNAITEGIFGAEGLMLTSIFLIPQRMAMWSVGVSYFMQGAGAAPTTPEEKRAHRKAVILKTIRHHRHPGRKIQRRLRLCQQVCGRFHGALPHHHPAVVPGGIKQSLKRLFLPRQREPFRLPLLNLLY